MDDQTRPIEQSPPSDASPPGVAPAPTPAPPPFDPSAQAGGSSRLRWVVGLGVAVLAIAIAVGAWLVLSKSSTPVALQYIPGDAAIVGELRMDLPGDQLQKVGNLLAHFPGFSDQSILSDKLDEALSRLVQMDPSAGVDYKADIKPWLNGAAFVGVMATDFNKTDGTGSAVISATTNGAVTCAATFKNQAVTHETYKGLDLVASADAQLTCVVDGRQALLGDVATVKLALDAKAAGTGMDKNAKYAAARTALGLDRLATVYVSGSAISSMMPMSSAVPGMPDMSILTGPVPDWTIAGVRAEDSSLVVDTIAAPVVATAAATGPSLLPLPATHASVLAPMLPADTLVFVEHQGAGVTLQNLLTKLQTVPQLQSALQTLDGLGGSGKLVGWVDDAGIAVSVHGTTPDAAVLLVAKDEASASTTVGSLATILALMGQSNGLTVKTSAIGAVTVTTVTITDLGALVPAGSVPGLTIPATGPISFSIAAHGKVVILTSGEAAMTAILNVATGASLADDATFKLAGQRGLANSRTTVYVAAGTAVDLVEGFLPADQLAKWKSDVKPYVDPLESVSMTATEDATANRSRLVVSVTKP
jgi:Protein of unknown function (DUF3352)